jgi:hypothetical protein
MELMAEVTSRGFPELEVVGLRDIQVVRGIVLEEDSLTVRVAVRPEAGSRPGRATREVCVEISDPDPVRQPYYRAMLDLADQLPAPPLFKSPHSTQLGPFSTSVEEAYRRYLFQGAPLQSILSIEAISEEGIIGTLRPSSPQQIIDGAPDGDWLIDPVVLEGGFQLVIIWTRVYGDRTPLPSVFRSYRRFGTLSGQATRCYVRSHFDSGGLAMHTDLYWVDSEARVLGVLKDAQSATTKALNRLAGSKLARGGSAR